MGFITLLVAGSRNYSDWEEFRDVMDYICDKYNVSEIVSGGAKGADLMAEKYSKINNIPIKIFKADWNYYGRNAGFKRNIEMHEYLKRFKDRACICFWDGESSGTKHNFKLCEENNTELIVYLYPKHRKIVIN